MHIFKSFDEFFSEIAKSADLCLKPWKHSVKSVEEIDFSNLNLDQFKEIILKIESRNNEGVRFPNNDLDLEIFRSGVELNIILSWHSFPLKPILWQGKHSLWMDGNTGKRTDVPKGGEDLESLARRLRARFYSLLVD